MNVSLQLIGLSFDCFAALLLSATEILSRKEIEAQSSTRADHNPDLRKALRQKSNVALLATVILIVGFFSQLIGTFP